MQQKKNGKMYKHEHTDSQTNEQIEHRQKKIQRNRSTTPISIRFDLKTRNRSVGMESRRFSIFRMKLPKNGTEINSLRFMFTLYWLLVFLFFIYFLRNSTIFRFGIVIVGQIFILFAGSKFWRGLIASNPFGNPFRFLSLAHSSIFSDLIFSFLGSLQAIYA